MKRGAYLIISTLLVVFLVVGCGSDPVVENPGAITDGEFQDGTYTAASNANPRGYVQAEVVIEDGAIASVSLKEFTDRGQEKDAGYAYDVWHEAIQELPSRFVDANSAEIDVVTEATSTSEKAMDAVSKALARSQGYAESFAGMFMGISEVSERGGWGIALVTLDDQGNITEVELKEMTADGFKDEDYAYEEWHDAVAEMPQRFVSANSSEVDAFTGATSSSNMWMQAVEDALQKAN